MLERDESGAEGFFADEVAVSGTWTCTEPFRAPVVAPDARATGPAPAARPLAAPSRRGRKSRSARREGFLASPVSQTGPFS
jgi:hypothetical protein